jgi:hypothetical protein
MSFLASFVTGFATQATKDIEERDKELRDEATMRWNSLLKEREKATLRAEKRKEEVDTYARQLSSLGQGLLTEQQIVAAIASGNAKEIVESLSSIKTKLTSEQAKKLIQVGEDQEVPTLAKFREQTTELKPGAVSAPSEDQMRGAFGLRTRAFEQGLKSASAQTGVSMEDIYKTKLGDMPTIKAIVDLTATASPKEFTGDPYARKIAELRLAGATAKSQGDTVAAEAIDKELEIFVKQEQVGKPAKEPPKADPRDQVNALIHEGTLLRREANTLLSSGNKDDIQKGNALFKRADGLDKEANEIFKRIPRVSDAPAAEDPFKNLATFRSDFRGIFSTATEAAQTRIGGSGFVPSVNPITGDRTLTYTGTDPKAWEAIYEERRKLANSYVNTVVQQAGKVPPAMIVAASGMGIDISKDGKVTVQRLGKEAGNIPESTPAAAPQASKPSGVAAARATSTRTIVRTGTVQSGPDKGRKVIEYSDGTREIQ